MKRFQNQAPCRTCIVALSCIAGLRRIAILVQKVLFYCSFVKKVVQRQRLLSANADDLCIQRVTTDRFGQRVFAAGTGHHASCQHQRAIRTALSKH